MSVALQEIARALAPAQAAPVAGVIRIREADVAVMLTPAADKALTGELDASGAVDRVCDLGDGQGMRHQPLFGADGSIRPRSREAFIAAAGAMGREMLQRAEAVAVGEWAGVEG